MRALLVDTHVWLAQEQGLRAQQSLAWRLDPHAGLSSAFLNPAASLNSPYDWELNLAEVGGFFTNDYVYIEQASALSLLASYRKAAVLSAESREGVWQIGPDAYRFDYRTLAQGYAGSGSLEVLGPSLAFRLGEKTRIGLFSRLRTVASARAIDPEFGFYNYDALPFGSRISLDETYGAAAIWTELGLQLSHEFYLNGDAGLRLGANLRPLFPIDAISAYIPAGGIYTKIGRDSLLGNTIGLEGSDLSIGFTNGFRGQADESSVAGRGWGIDIGLQYAWEVMEAGGYRYALGFSILDIGSLQINQGAALHRFRPSEQVVLASNNYSSFEDPGTLLDTALQQLNIDFYGGGNSSLEANSFLVGLPTAFSLQLAYRPSEYLQLTAAHVGDLLLEQQQLSRGHLTTLAAHYSRWWWGLGLAANMYNFRYLNLGLQARLGPLFFGTDRLLGTVLRHPQLQGGDFVVGLRLHDFSQENSRRGKSRRGGSRGRSRRVRCYQF